MRYLGIFLKWSIQILTMLSDLILIAAIGVGIYAIITTPIIPLKVIMAVLMVGAYHTWKDQGGFMSWRKKDRQLFSENWDKIMKEG